MIQQQGDIRNMLTDVWKHLGLIPWILLAVTLVVGWGATWGLSFRSAPVIPPSYQATVLLALNSPTSGPTLVEIAPFLDSSAAVTLAGQGKIINITATSSYPANAMSQASSTADQIEAAARRMRNGEDRLRREQLERIGIDPADLAMLPPSFSQVIDRIDQNAQLILVPEPKSTLTRDMAIMGFLIGVMGVMIIFGVHYLTASNWPAKKEVTT